MRIIYNRTIGVSPGEEIIFEGTCSLYQAYIKKHMFILQELTKCDSTEHYDDTDLVAIEEDLIKNIRIEN